MKSDLERRVRELERRAGTKGFTFLVEYQVRDDHEKSDFQRILEDLHSKYPGIRNEKILLIRRFLCDEDEQVPKLLEVRPYEC